MLDFIYARRNFLLGEFAKGFAYQLMFFREGKVHVRTPLFERRSVEPKAPFRVGVVAT
jgi:hypothetical protein